ncbi:glycosyltransferase family 2 protein [Pseudomonas sp. SWI6]|uniref:Glycosyltransferase family 2 protein n=1 Tax=Pseudomonas taiwanensis TaxID=470150 RepID=A0ABR6VDR5_9PSED|nr:MULTISPECIES: glycosyltransferase family 2 protein [Pseudomonas]AGZ35204.1 glycosyl transferase family protein [Pseudomonas sp. VLB120]AVD83324.1 glycosyltransferase family 2 protein [Pseudomonas sp. SWI6]AVD90519.1 glycosyltransferase family 2 protein [Pseudomonas sp. SWI44]MBC3478544.1 glycosyltransferase family 2 protein [Pseudomonas taiwanensis]MBC3493447.1 glycosyltransferase family 2 protein [Pseudomonas taiwanensis]
MDRKPVDVMVVNFNTASLLQPMFDALRKARGEQLASYLVVDNASVDDSVARMAQVCPQALLVSNKHNVGFGRANNQLLEHLQGKYALLLNTDAFVASDTLDKTLEYMEAHPECGVLGVRLVGRDGDLQPCCRYFPTPLNIFVSRTGLDRFFPGLKMVDEMSWDHGTVRECDWLPGCFYLVRREVLDQVGLFDPRYFLYYEEVDHCKRVKEAGWKVVFYPHTTVVHIGGESSKSVAELEAASRQISTYQIESELLYFRKHHGVTGLILHMLLVSLGDAILALKALLKGRGWAAIKACWLHTQATWSSLFATRFARQPTR